MIKTTFLKPFSGKKVGYYNLILNVDELNLKRDEKINFYVRIFASRGSINLFELIKKKLKLMNYAKHTNFQSKEFGKIKVVEDP